MSNNTLKTLVLSLFASAGVACSASSPAPSAAKSTTPAHGDSVETAGPTITFATQVAKGAELFGANCASCHGDSGQGTRKAPAVVGDGVLPLDPPPGAKHRDVQFKTALDVFLWVKKTMPADDPGSLSDEEYVSILAFDLNANGVKLDKPLDGEVAAGLKLQEAGALH